MWGCARIRSTWMCNGLTDEAPADYPPSTPKGLRIHLAGKSADRQVVLASPCLFLPARAEASDRRRVRRNGKPRQQSSSFARLFGA